MIAAMHELVVTTAGKLPDKLALKAGARELDYAQLAGLIERVAYGYLTLGLAKQDRVAVYLPKRIETVAALFAASQAGGVFVPVNPLLKAAQVKHILNDCTVRILVTSADRLAQLGETLSECRNLAWVVLTDHIDEAPDIPGFNGRIVDWKTLLEAAAPASSHRSGERDVAAILYTSGSTGKPKGVVLSHRNMVCGAQSVAAYLENTADDRLLSVLPFSFDYGFSQLSTAFLTGAAVVLLEYLLPRDVVRAVEREQITGLAGVPPLWIQLSNLDWPEGAAGSLRYITNSGGRMPRATVDGLRNALPRTKVYLMYGLTEAFRSTYLPPEQIDQRPDSIGKAIPNAEILVVNGEGALCGPGEPGELVHRGPLVALGYWGDEERTARRFRSPPAGCSDPLPGETAVYSGDIVTTDADGFLYFCGRNDEMIKTSGYRVSPTEIEEAVYATGLADEAVALGVTHPTLGQAIVVIACNGSDSAPPSDRLIGALKAELPNFMIPQEIVWRRKIPRNPNGKMDRTALASEYAVLFSESLS